MVIDRTTFEVAILIAYLAGCIFGMIVGRWSRLG